MGTEPQIHWGIMAQIKYWEFFSPTLILHYIFFGKSRKHVCKYLQTIKITFRTYV
jgi:hypothetical protein